MAPCLFRVEGSKVFGLGGGWMPFPLEEMHTATESEPDGRLAESWFRLIVEAAPNAMLVVDRQRCITLVNHRTEAMFGYARDELIGQAVEMLVPERFRGAHAHQVHGFFVDPRTRAMGAGRELFGRRKDGSEVPIEIGLNPIESPGGLFILASIIDITERKHAEQRFRLVVEAAPNAMLMVDAERTITLVNRKAEDMFGYTRDELVGQAVELLVPERFRLRHPGHVQGFFLEPKQRAMGVGHELFGRRKDGSEVPIEIGLNPLETPEGLFTLASIIDITERKRQEGELRRSNEDLEQFAYIASHDLQEPLRMVASYTELLAQRYQGQLDARADKYIYYAVDGAKRMQTLIADLLAYSRVGSQGKPLAPVSADLVVANVLRTLRGQIRELEAEIDVGPLPTVLADESQLGQLFQNLIGNALKFRGESPPQIRVRARAEGEHWVFSVQDNGIGISMQYAERVFQMFQRLHERGRYEGSGIGLAIAKRILERHGGKIWLESELGVGTTFFFTLQASPSKIDK
jgi:PAS domain S-box-containing protein